MVRQRLGELPGNDTAMLLKSAVRATLPVEFRTLIHETGLDTWEKYLSAVAAVSVDRINDAVETRMTSDEHIMSRLMARPNATPTQRAADEQDFAAQMIEQLGLTHLFTSPMRSTSSPRGRYIPPAARQSQPAPATRDTRMYLPTPAPGSRSYQTPTTAVDQRVPWVNRSSPDVFTGSTAKQVPNTFTKSLFATQISPSAGRGGRISSLSGDPTRDVELARVISENPRSYTSDTAGIQRYSMDMSVWMSQNGNSSAPDYTTFPLSPGTVAAGSKECFRCGMLTNPPHFGRGQCEAQNGHPLPTREQNLRNMVGAIIHPIGQRTPARVNQIGEPAYDPFGGLNADQPLYEEDLSENGEEPAV